MMNVGQRQAAADPQTKWVDVGGDGGQWYWLLTDLTCISNSSQLLDSITSPLKIKMSINH